MSFAPSNEWVLAPMTTYSSLPNGELSLDEEPYLQRRARGGFGTVVTAACAVHPTGWVFEGQWACWDDVFLLSLRRASAAIHRGDPRSLALLQIHHGGRTCSPMKAFGGPIAPSAIPSDRANAMVPHEMTEPEILRSLNDYASAAERAMRAGFDGVEIHGANTYLVQQFVSPHSNRRTDRWNADDLRFPVDLARRVREAVGPCAVVGYRFSPEEPETPGILLDRTLRLLEVLLETETLDYLHVSLRRYDGSSIHNPASPSVLETLADAIARRVPFLASGEIRTAEDVASARALGATHIAVGRAAVSDPEWPEHIESGLPPRTKLPRGDFAALCTLPAGLARKIETTPGWFEFELETSPRQGGKA